MLFKVDVNTLFNIGCRQNFLNGFVTHFPREFFHQIKIADGKVANPPQPGAGIADKAQQYPAGRVHNLIYRQIRRICFINIFYHVGEFAQFFLAVVFVNNMGAAGRFF